MARQISQENVIVYETYLNICRFYEVDDVIEESSFNTVVTANSYLKIKNKHTGLIILILCSMSKYTQQNVNTLIKKLKNNLQVVITNEISHPKILLTLVTKHSKKIIDVCPQHMFVFGEEHILNQNTIRKYTKNEYIKQERCGIYDDINDFNSIYLDDKQLVLYNLKVKNETLKEIHTLNLKYKDSIDYTELDVYSYVEPNNNVFSFLSIGNKNFLLYGGFLTDNSRFNKKSVDIKLDELISSSRDIIDEHSEEDDSNLVDLKAPVKKGDGIVYNKNHLRLFKDKNKINHGIYVVLENIIRKHNNEMFKIGDIALFNNEFLKTPLVFAVKPQKSLDNFEKVL